MGDFRKFVDSKRCRKKPKISKNNKIMVKFICYLIG